jgi:hypothetical protein
VQLVPWTSECVGEGFGHLTLVPPGRSLEGFECPSFVDVNQRVELIGEPSVDLCGRHATIAATVWLTHVPSVRGITSTGAVLSRTTPLAVLPKIARATPARGRDPTATSAAG